MKIVHLTPSYWPQVGGVETHVQEVCRELVAQGHDCRVITTRQPTTVGREVKGGVTIQRIVPNHQPKFATWVAIWRQRRLLIAADVIHVHDVAWWLVPVWWFIRSKLFITFHGWETKWPIRWQAKVQRWVWAQLSQGTIHVGSWISRYYWDWPTIVTYGGVRLPSNLKRVQPAAKQLRFVFIGRLAADNDIEAYVALIAELKRRLGDAQVVVTWVGDGPLRQRCASVGTVTGWLLDPWPELQRADIIGASSYLALWQALVVGGPVCSLAHQPLKVEYLASFPAARLLLTGSDGTVVAQQVLKLVADKTALTVYRQSASALAASATWAGVADQYLTLWQKK